jgi:hypothetical protein
VEAGQATGAAPADSQLHVTVSAIWQCRRVVSTLIPNGRVATAKAAIEGGLILNKDVLQFRSFACQPALRGTRAAPTENRPHNPGSRS